MKKALALCGAVVAGFGLGILATFIRDNVVIVEVEKPADDEDEDEDEVSCDKSDDFSFDDESLFEDESAPAESDATDDSTSEEASI